ncbi:hypothetical protein [Methylobacterium brachythecii]|uniref:TubC N-terminal docking domain-containing protein n=1 Tax=Methylobacterium brachythecii TaxID=1176177 RepID=A0A7W6F9C9_9HYPH|nr:hypothetical protein [Methylobacterium brachythecii]MBB3905403.1 hypothetical protein [Methylobacterium brachythecii]GLS46741.1 hypothetical protein GCM10007884_47360 [Methylobacterium brachythecii]
MTDATAAETMAVAHAQLREALDYLEAHGLEVLIDGDRFVICSRRMTRGELVEFASMLTPVAVNVLQ